MINIVPYAKLRFEFFKSPALPLPKKKQRNKTTNPRNTGAIIENGAIFKNRRNIGAIFKKKFGAIEKLILRRRNFQKPAQYRRNYFRRNNVPLQHESYSREAYLKGAKF